jgi:heme/copper-type cytochrome/quinol oxidase subunit 3
MLIFVAAEVMFFAGLISAFTIVRAESMIWPPPDQPRLPIERTALNTLALLASGVALYFAQRAFGRDRRQARTPLLLATAWLRLRRGWLVQSQLVTAGAFWYFVVGLWPVLYGVVYW